MLTDPIPIKLDGRAVTNVARINQDGNASSWFAVSGDNKCRMRIAHTIPAPGKDGESHLIRVDVDYYTGVGVYTGTESVWFVTRTTGRTQDSVSLLAVAKGLIEFLGASNHAELTKVIGQQV